MSRPVAVGAAADSRARPGLAGPGRAGLGPTSVLVVLGLLAAAVLLAPRAAEAGEDDLERPALDLLERASQALNREAYTGTQFVSTWSSRGATAAIVDLTHVPDQGTLVQVRPNAGGQQQELLMRSPAAGALPVGGLDEGALGLLARHYDLRRAGTGTCAGRTTAVVEARPASGGSIAGRFWVDEETGLVLRREVYDRAGRAVRASAFVSLDYNRVARLPADLPPPMPAPSGRSMSPQETDALRAQGAVIPSSVAGGLELYDVARTGVSEEKPPPPADPGVLRLSYSDGLSSASVFVQPGRLDPSLLRGFTLARRAGAAVWVGPQPPEQVVWSARGSVYTVLTDAPAETVDAIVADLPHDDADSGAWARLGRGLSRVASWLNPFA